MTWRPTLKGRQPINGARQALGPLTKSEMRRYLKSVSDEREALLNERRGALKAAAAAALQFGTDGQLKLSPEICASLTGEHRIVIRAQDNGGVVVTVLDPDPNAKSTHEGSLIIRP